MNPNLKEIIQNHLSYLNNLSLDEKELLVKKIEEASTYCNVKVTSLNLINENDLQQSLQYEEKYFPHFNNEENGNEIILFQDECFLAQAA